jgi:hypothetical protein
MSKEREKYERQRRQRATENMRKAFERFNTAMTIMSGSQVEVWTPEELEKVTKIVNQWASTMKKIAEKMNTRHRSAENDEINQIW